MAKKRNKILAGLAAVAGGISAVIGVRALVNWYMRPANQEYTPRYLRENAQQGAREGERENARENAFEYAQAIPSTGAGAAEIVLPEVGVAEEGVISTSMEEVEEQAARNDAVMSDAVMSDAVMSDRVMTDAAVSDRDMTDPADTRRAETNWAEIDEIENGQAAQGIPSASQAATSQPVTVSSLVGPLVVHLISFHNMMELLKKRRETVSLTQDANTHTPDVRAGGADAVSSLEGQVPEFDRAALVRGSLQERMIQLMDQIRETLQNTDVSEDELFKISDKLRPAACKVLEMIHQAEEDDVTGFEDVQKAYACR